MPRRPDAARKRPARPTRERRETTDPDTVEAFAAGQTRKRVLAVVGIAAVLAAATTSAPSPTANVTSQRHRTFASAPTTAEALLLANWERGAEWRDWFLSPERVVTLEAAQPEAMQTRVQAELAALKDRRERRLSTPLINPPRAGDSDPIALTMARVADSAALLRRIMELHYPRILRQYAPIRALLRGDSGLVTRDRVRLLRDAGVPARDLSQVGLQRVAHFREIWLELPAPLRERGQRSPELDYGLERLGVLERQEFSRPAASPVGGQSESSSAP